MNMSERARCLVVKIDAVSKLPLLMRATKAESLVREAAELLVELSRSVEQQKADLDVLASELKRVGQDAKLAML